MIQLNPPLPMNTPKGEGFAHVLIDYGPESDLYWTVFITETGEIWTFANRHVRASKNITLGRTHSGQPQDAAHGPVPMRPVGQGVRAAFKASMPVGGGSIDFRSRSRCCVATVPTLTDRWNGSAPARRA